MANLISSVDALFSYYGATLFVLGLLCCFTKRTFKFGVLTLLLADIPLALAIAFPRKVIEQLNSWGFQAQDFPDVQTGHTYGIIAGVVTFVVLFAIRYLLNSMLSKRKVIAQKSDNSDDAPIDIAEDDPSINQSSADNKIFKGLAIKGKKSHQSASALHLSSDDNPLNLADTQAEFSALKKNDEHGELANNLGSEPSFAQDPHESFSLGQVPDHDSDNMKEPTLSSDVFTNHMSHNEPSFSNSFIENASLGSLKHNYAAVQKPLENQASVGIASLGVQNPLTGQTDNKEQSGSSSWSSLFSKINQAQENTNSSELQERFSSLDGDDSFSGYGPKSKSIAQQALKKDHVPYIGSEVQDEGSLDLNNLSFAGNKVGDLLDAIDDPNHEDKLKERLGVKDNSSQPESAPFNFADILDSAAKRQSLEEEKELDSYDQLSMQPHNVDRMGDDNVSPDQLSEEQLAYAALGKSHKTVAEALADLDSQEQELEPELETATASAPAQSPAQPNEQADTHINSELLEGDNKKVDIGSPDPSLQIMEPTKISYLYSDPVHEDKSKEEEEERPENVLDQYQGDSTNYSFSIKGVFKEKPKLSVSSFVDRTSYLGQSQYEANFHEEELEQMVNANEAKEQIEPQIEQAESNSDKAEDLKNKRDQVLAIARQVAAQISAELDAKQSSSHINKEQSLDLLSNNDQEALQPSVGSSKKVAEDFAIDSHHTDDAQDEAHALASLFAHKKAPQSASARSASADSAAAAAAAKATATATATAKVPAASVEVASQSKSLEQKLNNGKELAKQSVSGLESKSLTEVIGSQDNNKFIDAERLDLAQSEEQKREDNKDIEIQPLNKAASILNPSERKAKRTVNIGASLEALKAKAKQAAQERAMAKEAALKAKQEAEQKAAQKAALKAEKEAEQKAAQEAAQAKILAAQKAQSQAEARAYKAAQNKDHSAANNQPKHFNIQHVAAPIESKSTLNNIAKRDNKVNVARDRGLSFIEKLKAQAKNASKPKADAAVLATSKATPAAPAPAKVNAPANAHAVAAAKVTAKSASGELKAQPNKATVQDKQQVLAKTNATASQKATNSATAQSKAPAVAPAKAKVEVLVPPKVATSAKTNASASVPAKDPALVKAQSATKASVPTVATAAPVAVPAKAPAQAPATKEAKTQATGKVGANASAKPQAQALAKSKTDSGALDNKKGFPVEAAKTEVVTAKVTAQAPAQAQVPVQAKVSAQAQVTAKEQATGKEQALAKEHEHEHEQASAQSQVVKASLKNKKRNHKKAEDGEKVELSQEALKKDAALASMSSLDDLDEKVMLSRSASGAGAAQAQQDAQRDSSVQAVPVAQSAQVAEAAKADGAAVRKSASLKRSFGLKRNRP